MNLPFYLSSTLKISFKRPRIHQKLFLTSILSILSSNDAQNQFNVSILNLQPADRRITLKTCITVPIFEYDG